MLFKEETRIMSSTDDEVEETLNTETSSMKEANMTRAKVKMEEVREENERLKLTLSQMLKDYNSLKMQFNGITQQDDHQSMKATNLAAMAASDDDEESDMVSLSLGRFSGDSKREEKKIITSYNESKNLENGKLELGLNCRQQYSDNSVELSRNLRSENSLDESKEEGCNDVRSSHRSPKNSRTGDDEILQHNPLKKPRVSVRAVCNTQTMHDGCQWRKYGQKIAKGNPCPRAYYRCTVSSSCPVRKQVQRCIDDMSILITTYEGTHNHPLPPSATTMSSATTAAAAMLSCGSSSATSPSLFGYNFTSPSPNNIFPRATISSSQSHPTVILDLTPPNHNNKKFSKTLFSTTQSPPPSFNFSSNYDPDKFHAVNNAMPPPYSQPPLFSSIHKQAANDQKIAAAITHDPSFQSALAAAITSFVGKNNNSNVNGIRDSGMNFHHLNFSQPSSSNGCAASFMNRFPQPAVNSQQNNLTHFAPLALAASKSRAMSMADEGEVQINL